MAGGSGSPRHVVTMTRPPGASFAQFFPTAPRAARDRAEERQRARKQASDLSPSASLADQRDAQTPNGLPDDGLASTCSRRDGSLSDAAQQPPQPAADDAESLQGDTLNAVGSASSHGSSAASSVFSSSARHAATAAASKNPAAAHNHLTPLTTIESPSYSVTPHSTRPAPSAAHGPGKVDAPLSNPPHRLNGAAASDSQSVFDRAPARDPACSVKGVKCTYDPLLDRSLSSSEKKKAKPTYEEFGLVRNTRIYCWGGGQGGGGVI